MFLLKTKIDLLMELKKIILIFFVIFSFSALSAENQIIYTNVTFSANTTAKVLLTPISFISGEVINTNHEIDLGTEPVSVALPVAQWNPVAIGEKYQDEKEVRIILDGGKIIISTPNKYIGGKVHLYTLSGQLVQSSEVGSLGVSSLKINGFMGLYVLHVSNHTDVFSTKILLHSNENNLSRTMPIKSKAVYKASEDQNLAIYKVSVVSMIPEYDNIAEHQLNISYNDTIVNYTLEENPTIASFQELLDSTLYEQMFPNRYGLGRANSPWDPNAAKVSSDGDFDFYSYTSLMNAIKEISKIRIEVWQRQGITYTQKIKWFNKETGETREMITHPDYNESWNLSKPEIKTADFDYADFCNEGDLATRKRELAAFLANTSHETTGQGSSFPQKTWGLYWMEEVAWQNGSTDIAYVDYGNTTYPPTPGKSYHGRGPIQISYNYNYGQVSEFIFGDKMVLLNNPEKVIEEDFTNDGIPDATLAFQTAIWFWMYPQSPKPSCHDVMVGNWIPTADDLAKGRGASKFGMTVNVINGGLECNKGDGDYRVSDRIGFYRHYASILGVTVEDYCDCGTMVSW